jgi:hypothetical protein
VKRLVTVVAIAILLIGIVLLGLNDTVPRCACRRPSEADVEEAVLRDIAGENGPSVFHSQWVTEVEVIEYGEPCIDKLAMMRQYMCWPVKVYFIGDQQRVQRRVWLNKGEFGEWHVVVPPQCY